MEFDHPHAEVHPGQLLMVVTYLEMHRPPTWPPVPAPDIGGELSFEIVPEPDFEYYRRLYDHVGEDWLWFRRRQLAPEKLLHEIHHPDVEIRVLHIDGEIAGYAELDRRRASSTELGYFGLMPGHTGKGLGRYMLDVILRNAWEVRPPARVIVNTCNFDHPAALRLYEHMGFEIVRTANRVIADPRLSGLMPVDCAPHIPIFWPPELQDVDQDPE